MAEEKHRDRMTKKFHGWLKRLVDKMGKPAINEKGTLKSVKKLRDKQNRTLKELD